MFEAGFAYILSKSLINTRTKNRQVCSCRFFLYMLECHMTIPVKFFVFSEYN